MELLVGLIRIGRVYFIQQIFLNASGWSIMQNILIQLNSMLHFTVCPRRRLYQLARENAGKFFVCREGKSIHHAR